MNGATDISGARYRAPAALSLLNRRTAWIAALILATGWSLAHAGIFQRDLINEGGWPLVARFVRASLQPKLTSDFLALTVDATFTTLAYAVCGTALSLCIGSAGAMFVSELWWQSILPARRSRPIGVHLPWTLSRAMLAIPRGIHELLWGLFFVNIFGLDPLTAILAIGVPFGAIVAKIFAEIIDETPRRPFQVLINSGVSPIKAFFYTLLPQALPDLLSYAFYRFECSIRAAALLGIIGAGGLGYQILLSVQTLKYDELWTLFYALVLLSGLADVWSAALRRRLAHPGAGRSTIEGMGHVAGRRLAGAGDRVIRGSLLVTAVLLPLSLWYLHPDISKLWSPRTGALLTDIYRQAMPPRVNWAQIVELVHLSGKTLAMSILAALFAAGGGMMLSFPAANNFLLPGGVLNAGAQTRLGRLLAGIVWIVSRLVLLFARAIPAPIWALVLLFVFFPGIVPGAIALGLYNLGILGRLMAEVTENMDERPLRALRAQGAPGGHIFLYGVLPTTMPRFIAYGLYRWEIAIRATVIVGLVGAGGLGRLLTEQLSSFDYRSVVLTLFFYIALTFLVDLISAVGQRTWR